MRISVAASAAFVTIGAAQNTTTSVNIDAISVPVPTTVFNLPIIYVTAENNPIYNGSDGRRWQIECGWNYAGNDIQAVATPDIGTCVQQCEKTNGCVGTIWVEKGQDQQYCWLKSALVVDSVPVIAGASVWSATPLPLQDGDIYTSYDGRRWQVGYNFNYWSYDTAAIAVPDLATCINKCDNTAGCAGSVWVQKGQDQQYCWLKSRLVRDSTPVVSGAIVWAVTPLS